MSYPTIPQQATDLIADLEIAAAAMARHHVATICAGMPQEQQLSLPHVDVTVTATCIGDGPLYACTITAVARDLRLGHYRDRREACIAARIVATVNTTSGVTTAQARDVGREGDVLDATADITALLAMADTLRQQEAA